MRVFVTGATGVLGRRVIPAMLAQGHSVTGVSRSLERLSPLVRPGMTPVECSLFDAPRITQAMRGHDVVINLATHVPAGDDMFLPDAWSQMDQIRRHGSAVLADSAVAVGAGRFIQESFAPIYPDCGDRWITEETPAAAPRHNQSVLDAEASAASVRRSGASDVVLRFALLYGPDDPLAHQVFSSTRRGWRPFVGRPEGFVALVTHDDAAAAIVAALTIPAGVYNVVDDEPMRRDAIGDDLARMLGVGSPRSEPPWAAQLAGSAGETLTRSLRIANGKLKRACTWAPIVANAREGFRLAFEAERKAGARV